MELRDPIRRLLSSRRILVLGPSGSGKTTLSLRLARFLKIQPIHLDACFWNPGWVSTPQVEWRRVVSSLVRKESWIMDGTYESTLDLRIPAADTLIVLERSRLICAWRVIKRRMTIDEERRPDAPPGQRVDRSFLRYVWRYPAVTRPFLFECIRQYGRDKELIVLEGSTGIARFLQQLEGQQRGVKQLDRPPP